MRLQIQSGMLIEALVIFVYHTIPRKVSQVEKVDVYSVDRLHKQKRNL